MSATQHKTYFINRKERNEIRYHHELNEGLFYENLTISRSFPAYGKMLAKQFHFYSGPSSMLRFSSYIAMQFINLNADLWEKSFFVIFLVHLEFLSDKRFDAGSRGVPKPIQPMSLLNLGLWRLLAGFFPKAGIRLPLLRNFRNMRKRL